MYCVVILYAAEGQISVIHRVFSVTGEQGYTAGLPWKALLEDVVPGLKDLARGLGEPDIS